MTQVADTLAIALQHEITLREAHQFVLAVYQALTTYGLERVYGAERDIAVRLERLRKIIRGK